MSFDKKGCSEECTKYQDNEIYRKYKWKKDKKGYTIEMDVYDEYGELFERRIPEKRLENC